MAYKKVKKRKPYNSQDLTGRRFGHWLVLRRSSPKKRKNFTGAYFVVVCDCGKQREVRGSNLRCGKTRGCGHYINRYLDPGESARNALFSSYRYGARTRGFVWRISKKYFKEITSRSCFYCEALPRPMMGNPNRRGPCNLNGIDRIDSNKGYTKKNCVACCSVCNIMKMNWSKQEFFNHIERVYKHTKKERNKMGILDQNFRTITCDSCGKTVTFDVKEAQQAVSDNPWLKTVRVIQRIFDGRNFAFCSDPCELNSVAAGSHNPQEPSKITPVAGAGAIAAAAAAAKAAEEATRAMKDGREVTLHGG